MRVPGQKGFTHVMANARLRMERLKRSVMAPAQSHQGYLVVTCVFRLSGALACMTITNNGLNAMANV